MKKGLRLLCPGLCQDSTPWENSPDEEGIKTGYATPFARLCAWENSPDEEGIKTMLSRVILQIDQLGRTALMKKGLRLLLLRQQPGRIELGRTALMKKGLRRLKVDQLRLVGPWENSPDEEGIKTRARGRHGRGGGLGRTALMKKGLRLYQRFNIISKHNLGEQP